MTEITPFDGRPDAELGAALRDALDGPETEAFVARVRLAVAHAEQENGWDVLARWAPAGMVAALAASLLMWMMLRPAAQPLDAPMQLMASAPARMEIAPAQPEADVLVTSLLEGR